MKTAKAVNYTSDMIQTIQSVYTGKDNAAELKDLEEQTGKNKASLIAKLSQLGLYVPAKATGKIAKPKYTKNARAIKICSMIPEAKEADAVSLESASVRVLELLEKALTSKAK